MVMNYYGVNVTQEEIAREIFETGLEGTISMQLVLYPVQKGFEAEMYNGHLEDLKEKVRAMFPLIVSVREREGAERGHYMVVWGFDEWGRQIFAHPGKKERYVIGYEDFLDMWKRADFLTVWIYPKVR
jgi:ABC-type bacteriocin/lantibiotic exporter with double-glycine peptidase domain